MSDATLNPGSEHIVTIVDIGFGGEGIARINGQVIFVPFVITGEKVRVKLKVARKNSFTADLIEVIEPHPSRVAPPCPVFGRCGGCDYQHMSYPAQLAAKEKQVRDVIERIGKIPNPPMEPIIGSPCDYGYRNKVTLHANGSELGYMDRSGSKIVSVNQCPIASEGVNIKIQNFVKEFKEGEGDYVFRDIPQKMVSLESFFQINSSMLPQLLDVVKNAISPVTTHLIDAYCGVGLFAFHLADRFKYIVGIELEPKAIETANQEAAQRKLSHIAFVRGSVETYLPDMLEPVRTEKVCLIIDPPRTGCTRRVLEATLLYAPEQVIYVSCNPATLARDLKEMMGIYQVRALIPLDMFPQTAHVEVVCILDKRQVPL
ncbi:MAG: class I SAM-dependent RNA methyltransferase [Verrucomicrobiota bacterium]|nr:class I SAM-dependent RNA methyltransferase [Verrucomicrobiota bacterium]